MLRSATHGRRRQPYTSRPTQPVVRRKQVLGSGTAAGPTGSNLSVPRAGCPESVKGSLTFA